MSRSRPSPAIVAGAIGLGILGLGLAISASPFEPARSVPSASAPSGNKGAFDNLFKQGVQYLSEGRTHQAIVVLEAARSLGPKVPEVAVNLGFAHLARGDHAVARNHFERALELKPDQINAYYGLGMALEAEGDIEMALGAMRTFLHFEPEGTEYWRRAGAAVWEWDDRLRRQREGASNELPAGAVSLPEKMPVRTYDDIRRGAPPPEAPR